MTELNEVGASAPATEPSAPKTKKSGWPKGRPRNARPKVREEPREDEEAARPMGKRTRQSDTLGRFGLPTEEMKQRYLPGRTIEWKRHTVLGQEDPAYSVDLRRWGWEPVHSHQMPGIMPKGYKGAIIRDGLMLYERPEELTREARAEESIAARERIAMNRRKLSSAGPGEMTRDNPQVQPRIRQSFEPVAISKT